MTAQPHKQKMFFSSLFELDIITELRRKDNGAIASSFAGENKVF